MQDIYNKIIDKIDKSQVVMHESMSKYTSFKVRRTCRYNC